MATSYFRYDSWTKTAQGPAVPGAQIYVCTQPANVNSAPPSPLASIYSDPNGLVPVTQPLIADGFGHVDFYALAGVYTIVVALGGIIQQVYPDQSLGGVGSGGGTGITFQANGTALPNQTLLNLYSSDDSVIITPDADGDGGVNLQASVSLSNTFGSYMIGAGILDHMFVLNNVNSVSTNEIDGSFVPNGTLVCYYFQLPVGISFSKCSAFATNNTAGFTTAFGIYTVDGDLVVNGGSFNQLTSPSVQTNTFTKVELPAAGYYFVQATNNNTGSASFVGLTLGSSGVYSDLEALFAKNFVRFATADNLATTGPNNPQGQPTTILPATLGTLTPFTPNGSDSDGFAAAFWE